MARIALIIALLFAPFLSPQAAFAQLIVEERLSPEQPLVVISHRAVGGGAPENSLAGIQYAIELGVDMVEIDIQMTQDGRFILMHDWSLRRTTNVEEVFPGGAPLREGEAPTHSYLVSDFTLEDIAKLRLIDPDGGEHPVPNLETVLEIAKGRLLLLLELKNWDVEKLVSVLEDHDTRNILLWSQTNPRKLRDTAEAVGAGVAVMSSADSINNGLGNELELFGPLLILAGISFSELSPELIARAVELGVRVDVDTRFYDPIEPDGAVAPWLTEVLNSGAAAAWTRQPHDMLRALGR